MERETGLEPATTCLEGRDSTTELLPRNRAYFTPKTHALSKGSPCLRPVISCLEQGASGVSKKYLLGGQVTIYIVDNLACAGARPKYLGNSCLI